MEKPDKWNWQEKKNLHKIGLLKINAGKKWICLKYIKVKETKDLLAIFLARVKLLLRSFYMEEFRSWWKGSYLWLDYKLPEESQCVKMRKVVADWWHTTRYPISIDWVTMGRGHDVEWPKTPSEPQLKTSLMTCTRASIRCISWN